MIRLKLRAEFYDDAIQLYHLIKHMVANYRMQLNNSYSGTFVTFEVEEHVNWASLWRRLHFASDGNYMFETITLEDQFTGERCENDTIMIWALLHSRIEPKSSKLRDLKDYVVFKENIEEMDIRNLDFSKLPFLKTTSIEEIRDY